MFVAVWPDDTTRHRLSALELGAVTGLRMVRPEQWHVTLRFLGEVDEHLVPEMREALEAVAHLVPVPVRCEVGPATAWFDRSQVLQLPVAGLDELADAVSRTLQVCFPEPNRAEPAFSGHLTLARARRRGPDPATMKALAGIPFHSEFEVDSFDLVISRPPSQDRGLAYEVATRIPLL